MSGGNFTRREYGYGTRTPHPVFALFGSSSSSDSVSRLRPYRPPYDGRREVYYPWQRSVPNPPGFPDEENVIFPSGLTPDQQQSALNKLKKDIYNPTPKKLIRGLSLYYRNNSSSRDIPPANDNDGKNCAVCLEDFEPRESVMLTPCNHMFHEECIVPWIKSKGKCPVCRYDLCDRIRRPTDVADVNVQSDDLLAMELMTVIRAMEEAFLWGNASQ